MGGERRRVEIHDEDCDCATCRQEAADIAATRDEIDRVGVRNDLQRRARRRAERGSR